MGEFNIFSEDELLNLKYNGFSDLDIQRKLNGEQLVSDKVGIFILEKVLLESKLTEVSDFYLQTCNSENYTLDEDLKQQIMLDYIFASRDFQILEEKKDCFLKILLELYRIPFLNKAIYKYAGNSLNLFYVNHFEKINGLFSKYVNSIIESKLFLDKELPVLTKEEVISIVIQYFDEIDSSGTIKKQFFDGIESENILFWDNKLDKDKRKEYATHRFFSSDILETSKFFSFENKLFINILLEGNLEDVYTVVHEFFHKYSHNSADYLYNERNLFLYELSPFSELVSIYFESHLCIFLKKIGFSENETLVSHNYRKIDNISIYAHNIRFNQLMMKVFFDKQQITLDDFVSDYSCIIRWLKDNMDESKEKLLSVYEDLNHRKIAVAKNQCDDFIKSLIFDLYTYYRSYNYIFGTIITDYLFQKEDNSIKWMLNFAKDMFLLDMDPYDILSMMVPSSMMFLFQYTYNVNYRGNLNLKKKDCGIKRLTLLNKD